MEQTITLDHKVTYPDPYLRLAACLVASHLLVVYGESRTVFEMMLMPEYYIAVTGSTIIAFVLFSIVRFVTIRLDSNFPWRTRTAERIGMQVFFGLVLPSISAFLLAALYFFIRGGNILETTYLRYDFQVVIMQLLLINVYYVAYYFYQQWHHVAQTIAGLSVPDQAMPALKDTFVVSKGAGNIILQLDEIAYCYRKEESNYLRTISGEDFFINLSLDEVQQQLPEEKFFRINRQVLAHRQAIKSYALLPYGKLEGLLTPMLEIDTVISQKRASAFKKWIDQ